MHDRAWRRATALLSYAAVLSMWACGGGDGEGGADAGPDATGGDASQDGGSASGDAQSDADTPSDTTPPSAELQMPTADVEVHQGDSVDFSASCDDAEGEVTHHWDFGDGSEAQGAEVSHDFDQAGSFDVRYTCRDAAGNESSSFTVRITTTNVAPSVVAASPVADLVVLPGAQLDFNLECADADDPDAVTARWYVGGESFDGVSPARTLDNAGTLVFEGRCEDPWGLSSSVTRTIDVQPPPTALYLSTENQLEYEQLLWSDPAGAPVVLNQSLFAPGGRVEDFVLSSGDVYYFADHTIAGRRQLYRANPEAPDEPEVLTDPPAGNGPRDLLPRPSGNGFVYTMGQTNADTYDLMWVDTSVEQPEAVRLGPELSENQDIGEVLWSNTGRFLAFLIEDSTEQLRRYDIWVADLDASTRAVRVVDAAYGTGIPVVFSPDDRYVAAGGSRSLWAADLWTLGGRGGLAKVEIASVSRNNLGDWAFTSSEPLLAYVARKDRNSNTALNVVDVAAALAGSGQLDEEVFADANVEGPIGRLPALNMCDDQLVFTAEHPNGFGQEAYYVNLVDWVSDFRADPGSEQPAVRLLPAFSPDDFENVFLTQSAFRPDCSGLAFVARLDDDNDDGASTQPVYQFVYSSFATAGDAPLVLDSGGSYVDGGLYRKTKFAPDGDTVSWASRENDRNRVYLSDVTSPSTSAMTPTLEGENADFLWLDDGRALVRVQYSDDAGLYLWDPASPSSPTALTEAGAGLLRFVLDAEGDGAIYQRSFSSNNRPIYAVQFDAPTVRTKLNGEGTANGANIQHALLRGDGDTVLFSAENENADQNHLYGVAPSSPGDTFELYPYEADPSATVVGTSVRPLGETGAVLYRAYKDGAYQMFRSAADGSSAPQQLGLAPATSLVRIFDVSPDGQWAVYHARDAEGGIKLYVKDVQADAAAIQISETAAHATWRPKFSHTGRYVTFNLGATPARAKLVDMMDLEAPVVSLTPDDLPDDLPTSATVDQLRQTLGSRDVYFGADDQWVYYAYDDTYAQHLRIVRRALPIAGDEQVVHSAVTAPDRIRTWQMSQDGRYIVYERNVHPDVSESNNVDWLYVIDTRDLTERLLSPEFDSGAQGVQSYEVFGHVVAARANASTSSGSQLHAMQLAGSFAPFVVHDALENTDGLKALGAVQRGPLTFIVYTARETGDAFAKLRIATHDGTSVTRTTLSELDAGDIDALVSEDGTWLWTVESEAGVCSPLTVRAVNDPGGPSVAVGAQPIAQGCAELPLATRP